MSHSRNPLWRLLGAGLIFVAAIASVLFVGRRNLSSSNDFPESLSAARIEQALRFFVETYQRDPTRIDILSVAAELANADGDLEVAVACFDAIPTEHPEYGHQARFQQGQILLRLDRAPAAEAQLREFLAAEKSDPQNPPEHIRDARERLRFILEVELRFEERKDLLEMMYAENSISPADTVLLFFPSLLRWNGPQAVTWCRDFWENDPQDLQLMIAQSRYLATTGKIEAGEQMAREVTERAPDNLRGWESLLIALAEQNQREEMDTICRTLPEATPADPWQLLVYRGQTAARQGNETDAIRYFEWLLDADPARQAACFELADLYRQQGEPEKQKEYLERAAALARIQNRLGATQQDAMNAQFYREIAEICGEIDLPAHAEAMERIADRLSSAESSE